MNDDSHFLMSLGATHPEGSYYRQRCHEIAAEIERLHGQLYQIRDVIPMSFLRACDTPGATGPTAQLDLVASIRLMVAKGRAHT